MHIVLLCKCQEIPYHVNVAGNATQWNKATFYSYQVENISSGVSYKFAHTHFSSLNFNPMSDDLTND